MKIKTNDLFRFAKFSELEGKTSIKVEIGEVELINATIPELYRDEVNAFLGEYSLIYEFIKNNYREMKREIEKYLLKRILGRVFYEYYIGGYNITIYANPIKKIESASNKKGFITELYDDYSRAFIFNSILELN